MDKEGYQEYLQGEHWRETKIRFLKTVPNECKICQSNKRLNVHHVRYVGNFGRVKNRPMSVLYRERNIDLAVLCQDCHADIHKYKLTKYLCSKNPDIKIVRGKLLKLNPEFYSRGQIAEAYKALEKCSICGSKKDINPFRSMGRKGFLCESCKKAMDAKVMWILLKERNWPYKIRLHVEQYYKSIRIY